MSIDVTPFRVAPGEAADLRSRPTRIAELYDDKADYRRKLAKRKARLYDLQNRLFADDRYAVLAIFQAMDAAGKDGAIEHVMSAINPHGITVHAFKQPSKEELDHDFLWRTTAHLPERGRIAVFNRSYYEEVLVVRVHPELLDGQRLPLGFGDHEAFWQQRFHSIGEHEAHLHRNGTRVVKFHLHLSADEQRQRFLDRLDDPDKNWKFAAGDLAEREHWDAYRDAYEAAISATSTAESPWYVVPADDKKNARLIITQVMVEVLRDLDTAYPAVDTAALARYREALES